jgi:hypothetical protein
MVAALAAAPVAALMTIGTAAPVVARSGAVEPADLARGGDPATTFLVRDTIHDGATRVAATALGRHERLWDVRGGYLLQDWIQRSQRYRLVFVGAGGHAGERSVIGHSPLQMSVAVSPSRARVAWTHGRNELTRPTEVLVAELPSGVAVASRTFPWARVVGVTGARVLLSRRGAEPRATTVWWNYLRHHLTPVTGRETIRADLAHNRIVVATGAFDEPAFCNRVAPLSHPRRTLWKSCRWAPHAWSPDGSRLLATHTYFDDVGTDRWLTMRANTGQRLGMFTGRLDWDAVWEDDAHALTLALGDSGKAAIIRCDVAGACQRASRLWDVGKATYQPNYIAPPVVLAEN